jgi:hypothetical protein
MELYKTRPYFVWYVKVSYCRGIIINGVAARSLVYSPGLGAGVYAWAGVSHIVRNLVKYSYFVDE